MIEGIGETGQNPQTDYMAMLRREFALNSQHSAKLLQVKMQTAESHREALTRKQLESMLMHAEKSIANEESSRALSRLFGKFSLLNKIMQTMG